MLELRLDDANGPALNSVFRAMIAKLPKPVMMPVNAALRAREADYDLRFHGGFRVTDKIIRVSSRELIEVLAGHRTFNDREAKFL